MWAAFGFTAFGTLGWIAYLWLLAHPKVHARRLGSWSFAVPLLANALGIVFLDQKVDAVYVIGALVIATSIFAVELTARNRTEVPAETT
jgi:drug/metabolite transporter (DMT)-like permease